MDKKEIKGIIEALLFTWGEPLAIEEISKIVNIDTKKLYYIMKELIEDLDNNKRGLRIVKMDDNYQIGTRPEYYNWIKELRGQDPPKTLSNATLETLSIIAYKQPVIKADIDYIRGVKSDRAIKTLIEKNLIRELGRLEKTGRPIIYGTTKKFLRLFSLDTLEELPDLKRIEIELEKIEEES